VRNVGRFEGDSAVGVGDGEVVKEYVVEKGAGYGEFEGVVD